MLAPFFLGDEKLASFFLGDEKDKKSHLPFAFLYKERAPRTPWGE